MIGSTREAAQKECMNREITPNESFIILGGEDPKTTPDVE
jgi:hypothetical protein